MFEELNLVVKYGGPLQVRTEGALAMHAIHAAFPKDDVPVPELFGWRVEDGATYVYMELVPGITLADAWSDLAEDEKVAIEKEMKRIAGRLKSIERPQGHDLIGTRCP